MTPVYKILSIIGTRPEAIKLAPVIFELAGHAETFLQKVCLTGQHREMLQQAVNLFGIPVDYNLALMTNNQTLTQISARILEGLEAVLAEEKPDFILVQGDTATAFCGSLAAYYHHIRVGHVEAGLRTNDKYNPYPEEMNRRLVAQLADLHFAPTGTARSALLNEGIPPERIFVTGNTVIDALLWMRDRMRDQVPDLPGDVLKRLDGQRVVLITGHRRESFGAGFENICQAIRQAADMFSDVLFVYPVHLNPNVRKPVFQILGGHERICLMDPISYPAFIWLMDHSTLILTDSGGVQEEAPSLGKPVLVMRETTERPEGIRAGNARLVGTDRERIIHEMVRLLTNPQEREKMVRVSNPYGDGCASRRIIDSLTLYLNIP